MPAEFASQIADSRDLTEQKAVSLNSTGTEKAGRSTHS